MDEYIDGTEFRFGFGDRGFRLVLERVVGLDQCAATANGSDCSADFFGFVIEPAGGDCHIRTAPRQRNGGGRADAASATGDERDFSSEIHRLSELIGGGDGGFLRNSGHAHKADKHFVEGLIAPENGNFWIGIVGIQL
jgi:hypothetical protein